MGKHLIITILIAGALCLSFNSSTTPGSKAAAYYDRQLDSLSERLNDLAKSLHRNERKEITWKFFACRNAYKKVELFIDVADPRTARLLNGPDLLRINEEDPADSMIPHGLQVAERIIYTATIDRIALGTEIKSMLAQVRHLRTDPDRIYYFRDDKVWWAMRLAVYRIVSMGITGFDAPISGHALPESIAVLSSISTITGYYKGNIGKSSYDRGAALTNASITYLSKGKDFNSFDRAVFIRKYIAPLSGWLTYCSDMNGYNTPDQRNPINPKASGLFASNLFDITFFSPNSNYLATPERAALGRKLFFDPILSGDGNRSCATCHQPHKAFTDGLAKPYGINPDAQLMRNTPTLWYSALQTKQFYDSRTATLENQLSAVVHNTEEMGGSLANSIPLLLADTTYNALFRKAYPASKDYITAYNIANAISSYVRTLVSFNSRFDRYIRNETDSFSAAEKNGFNLFMGKAKCGTCHYAPVFNGLIPPLYEDTESEILAVPARPGAKATLDADLGKFSFTRLPLHKYAFKTPTVRNISLTAPYMHNGVFATLEEVLAFYNTGGGAGAGISPGTQTLPADKLGLSKREIKDVIAFLHTLTDTTADRK
ncbi:MAG: cytochrome c peroxidase [Bacteroidota bacterium]